MNNLERALKVHLLSLPLLDAACKLKTVHTAFIKRSVDDGLMSEEEAIAEANKIMNLVNETSDVIEEMREEGIDVSKDNRIENIREVHERLKEKGVIDE